MPSSSSPSVELRPDLSLKGDGIVKRIVTTIATVATVAALGIVAPGAAYSEDVSTVETEEATFSTPSTRWVDSDGYVRLPVSELEDIASTQTPGEIEDLFVSGLPLNTLLDPATGNYLAAAVAEKVSGKPAMRAGVAVGGCGTTGSTVIFRNVGSGGRSTCFVGFGDLWIDLPSTYYISAGYADAGFDYYGGGGTLTVWAGFSTTLTTAAHFQRVTRS